MTGPVETERGWVAWFARNRVAANLVMGLIMVAGLLVLPRLKKEVFPDMSARQVTVGVAYPGASPEEVEESICRRVEETVRGLAGVERITSTAAENAGAVSVELLPGADMNVVLADVRNRIDAIDTFPAEAEEPVVQEVVVRRQVINVAVAGDVGERALERLGQRVRDELAREPGITQVELVNVRDSEVSIEVSEAALRRHGLTFDQVAAAVRRSSLDLPGGAIKTAGGEVLLRSVGQAYRGPDFEELVLLTRPDGTRVTLGQVATVADGFEDADRWARFDGKPSVLVQVFQVGDQDALHISQTVRDWIARTQPSLPPGVQLTPWRDNSNILRSRMELLTRNAAQGLLLVLASLALFLRFRLAFWVAAGIPTAFLGAIWLMPALGVTINMVSLFAFIVVLGIVVDDAIVVVEAVHQELERGRAGVVAAVLGTRRVAVPVVFGVLTTVAAFVPLIDIDSNARAIWRQVPLVVIPVLLFSLLESQLILPAHLSHEHAAGHRPPRRGIGRALGGVERAWTLLQFPFARGLVLFVSRVYRPVLDLCLRWRYATWAAGLAALALTLALAATGQVRFQFFPAVEGENVVALLTMPLGTPAEVTERAVVRLEEAARAVQAELDGGAPSEQGAFRHVLTSIGEQPFRRELAENAGRLGAALAGAHLGEVNVQLAPSEERTLSAEEVLQRWRQKVGAIPGAVELSFTASILGGENLDVQMSAPDVDTLRRAADALKAHLVTYAGVADVSDSLRAGKREAKLRIRPQAEALGLSLADVARQVRQAFWGEEAQRVQRGRDEVRVMVRYPAAARRSLGDLEDMRIRTPAGDEVPLAAAAAVDYGRGYATIKRTDLARTVDVTAAVDPAVGNANQIVAALQRDFVPQLCAAEPGLTVSFEGQSEEQARTLSSLLRGAAVALFAIYALMAIPLRSYWQPLLIMAAIPFGVVGAIWGHVLLGLDLSIVSMLGLVALTGVVVNDSLVLVDYVNEHRRGGVAHLEAVRQAGVARFRPILLTSLTTVASLTPLLLERSLQARFLMPMAVSLAFGVAFSTVISLILVPAGYLVLDDLKRAWRWFAS